MSDGDPIVMEATEYSPLDGQLVTELEDAVMASR